MQLIKKYFYLGIIAAIFLVYLWFGNQLKQAKETGKEQGKQEIIQNYEQQTKKINENTINTKNFQQRIGNKVDSINDVNYRLEFLQLVWQEQSTSDSKE